VSRKGRFLERSEYMLYRGAARMIGTLSDQRLRRWGSRLGRFAGVILSRRTELALRNVSLVFPDHSPEQARAIVQQCWEHFGRTSLEYLRVQATPIEEINRLCDLVNREILDQALAMDRGVLLLSAHFGSWEVGAQLLSQITSGVTTVARPLDNELLERDLTRSRSRTGIELVDKRGAAKSLVRGLREKRTIVLLPDQAVRPQEGILVPFLGREAWTTSAPARLALKFDTPIVFVFCIPAEGRHRIEFDGPILARELPEDERNVESITRKINETISKWILRRPELWLWMHNRWKGTIRT